ncbi:hypothetical protein BASA60_002731 [Batrachochytrium salamandrivorans]|nr:hypothetical protein BASA60_002731 [Batrachochytrium salamandrivorans]
MTTRGAALSINEDVGNDSKQKQQPEAEPLIDEDNDLFIPADMFEEPVGFRPPSPKPTMVTFNREASNVQQDTLATFSVNLVGKHSLWAHWLWNAGKSMTNYLDKHKEMVSGKNVLELGAAAALPTIISALNGATKVVSTDYPDPALLSNITLNAKENTPHLLENGTIVVEGFIWGEDHTHVLSHLSDSGKTKFDLILMADLIFNHNQHMNLLKSSRDMLAPNGVVYTTFTHHVVKWADRDMKFFDLAIEAGFKFEKIYEERWECMFPEDDGDVDVRSTVHGYKMWIE